MSATDKQGIPVDQQRGLYDKYRVERINDLKNKHKNCSYFVLDPIHDPFAIEALRAYAKACGEEFPMLANDLDRWATQAHFERTQKAISLDHAGFSDCVGLGSADGPHCDDCADQMA